jgi:hypothetical protein
MGEGIQYPEDDTDVFRVKNKNHKTILDKIA